MQDVVLVDRLKQSRMDLRTAKLALARKKLKDHQEKRFHKGENIYHENNNIGTSFFGIAKDAVDENVQETNDSCYSLEEKEDIPNVQTEIPNETKTKELLITNDTKTTELLITNKRKLETEIQELKHIVWDLESNYEKVLANCNTLQNQNNCLETELGTIRDINVSVLNKLSLKDQDIEECKKVTSALEQEKNYLLEQLDFTKTVLTVKETENISLHSKITTLENDLESTQLRLHQLTSGHVAHDKELHCHNDQIESFQQRINLLEQQLKFAQKECSQINSHYEHYVSELNEQLKSTNARNEELLKQTQLLSSRENALIEQISNMEIQLQNLRGYRDIEISKPNDKNTNTDELQQLNKEFEGKLQLIQQKYDELKQKYDELKQKFSEAEDTIKELEKLQTPETNLCISKLNADIENDKVAAQRATEQNKKLKSDLKEIEESFVKMSRDKLELTEKLDAEKFLNRELTVKLAEYVEMAKSMQIKLDAKDKEMIRLLASYREVEEKVTEFLRLTPTAGSDNENELEDAKNPIEDTPRYSEKTDTIIPKDNNSYQTTATNSCSDKSEFNHMKDAAPKHHAMIKLQERFLKIMDEVADLSDEKHRLEHIILQLQNETDTICEYVALYQQQRSLLKQRDEERSTQIKIFQSECERMKKQLNDLNEIINKLSADKELTSYFLKEGRRNDFTNVFNIINDMKNNFLVNSNSHGKDMKNFFPCACCSGTLIDL